MNCPGTGASGIIVRNLYCLTKQINELQINELQSKISIVAYEFAYEATRCCLIRGLRDMQQGIEQSDLNSVCEGIFQLSTIGIVITQCDGTIFRVNDILLKKLGYSNNEYIGKNYQEVVHPKEYRSYNAFVKKLRDGENTAAKTETRLVTADGNWIWAVVNARVVYDKKTDFTYWVMCVEDITQQRQIVEERTRALEETNALFEATKAALMEPGFKDATRSIFEKCRIVLGAKFGYVILKSEDQKRDEIILLEDGGLNYEVGSGAKRSTIEIYKQVYNSGKAMYDNRLVDCDESVESAAGHFSLNNALLAPLQFGGQNVGMMEFAQKETGFVQRDAMVADAFADLVVLVLQRHRSEDGYAQLQAVISQNDRLVSMGQLASGVSHELNNSLSYTLFNVESTIEDLQRVDKVLSTMSKQVESDGRVDTQLASKYREITDDAHFEQRFKLAYEGLLRIKDISTALGTFTRIEDDEVQPVFLDTAIEAAINMVFYEIKYRAKLIKDFNPISPVLAPIGKIAQLFLNILLNAVNAIEDGHIEDNKIIIRTWKEEGNVCASIRDTGCGIDKEQLNIIFKPVYLTKQSTGTGLGLSICEKIVVDLNGEISIESSPGEGTEIKVSFPVNQQKLTEHVELELDKLSGVAAIHGRVLVVDDEPGVRLAVARILKEHQVVEACSGANAMELLQQDSEFDVVMCDMMMPNISGIDLHKWLNDEIPSLAARVMFMTGGVFAPTSQSYLKNLDNVVFEKPFNRKKMADIVNQRIRMRHQHESVAQEVDSN